MLLLRKNPARYTTLASMMDSMLGHEMDALWNAPSQVPPVNVRENESGYLLDLMAPGRRKEQFKVEVKNGNLIISSKIEEDKNEESAENTARFTRKEYSLKSFARSFTLPESANGADIRARYEDGVLRVFVPKRDASVDNAHHIAIE